MYWEKSLFKKSLFLSLYSGIFKFEEGDFLLSAFWFIVVKRDVLLPPGDVLLSVLEEVYVLVASDLKYACWLSIYG